MPKVLHSISLEPLSSRDLNIDLCAEDRLLLYLAQPQIDSSDQEAIEQLLKQGINWDSFFKKANHHWIVLQIYVPLKQYCKAQIPPRLMSQLENYFLINVARSLCFTEELLTVLQLLADHDINAIPFKGPILAVSAYGNLARRKFSDLDILVSPQNFQRAIGVLTSKANYQKQPTTLEVYEHEYPLINPDTEIAIDLHQQISGHDFFPFPMTLDEMTPRLESVTMMEADVQSLHPEETILMLCIHGSKHTWDQLGWVCDFAAYVHRHPHLNWSHVLQNAREVGLSKILALGLMISYELLNLPMPADIKTFVLENQSIKQLSQDIYQRLFYPTPDMANEFSLKRFLLHLRMMERLQDKWSYLRWNFHRLITPTCNDKDQLKLPSAFSFLYYGVRVFRLGKLFSVNLINRYS